VEKVMDTEFSVLYVEWQDAERMASAAELELAGQIGIGCPADGAKKHRVMLLRRSASALLRKLLVEAGDASRVCKAQASCATSAQRAVSSAGTSHNLQHSNVGEGAPGR